mmetsp:Transcript_42572/g.62169  ORF Transcript_42572/g.62169 Transcript_42572/m.62169 type:complete len:515 (-) Transcript_42572:44-1588(-)
MPHRETAAKRGTWPLRHSLRIIEQRESQHQLLDHISHAVTAKRQMREELKEMKRNSFGRPRSIETARVDIKSNQQDRRSDFVQSGLAPSMRKLLEWSAQEPGDIDCFEGYLNSEACQKADSALVAEARDLIRVAEEHLVLTGGKSPFVGVDTVIPKFGELHGQLGRHFHQRHIDLPHSHGKSMSHSLGDEEKSTATDASKPANKRNIMHGIRNSIRRLSATFNGERDYNAKENEQERFPTNTLYITNSEMDLMKNFDDSSQSTRSTSEASRDDDTDERQCALPRCKSMSSFFINEKCLEITIEDVVRDFMKNATLSKDGTYACDTHKSSSDGLTTLKRRHSMPFFTTLDIKDHKVDDEDDGYNCSEIHTDEVHQEIDYYVDCCDVTQSSISHQRQYFGLGSAVRMSVALHQSVDALITSSFLQSFLFCPPSIRAGFFLRPISLCQSESSNKSFSNALDTIDMKQYNSMKLSFQKGFRPCKATKKNKMDLIIGAILQQRILSGSHPNVTQPELKT